MSIGGNRAARGGTIEESGAIVFSGSSYTPKAAKGSCRRAHLQSSGTEVLVGAPTFVVVNVCDVLPFLTCNVTECAASLSDFNDNITVAFPPSSCFTRQSTFSSGLFVTHGEGSPSIGQLCDELDAS